ncbi:hypothetical protein [Streptacidiphilus melanogenes]|uniref:hypothetical protein n=1 Tax=Streptacidiphilus melanogenes TaxID=411235 RepID=UPI0005A786EC|nr:hypothetical protein [Streptacidiphilus melanogenes]
MTTTKAQFEQRLGALTGDWVSRTDLRHLAGISEKTLKLWLGSEPFTEDQIQIGPRGVLLYARDPAATWIKGKLFEQGKDGSAPSGPRLSAEPTRMPHAPGDRWRWTDIARLRGVTPGAVSNLAKAYEAHAEHPFPPAEADRKRSAEAVAAWFLWYDEERPGYAERGKQATPSAPAGRVGEVVAILEHAVAARQSLSAEALARSLDVTPAVAARYLAQAEDVVMSKAGLIARSAIAAMLPDAAQLTPRQRTDRVKTLLRRKGAPRSVLSVGSADYFDRTEVTRLLTAAAR